MMDNASQRIDHILSLMLRKGYLAPDHSTAIASKLLEAEPLPDAFALIGSALIRHAAILDPFDRDKLRLANDVQAKLPHRPFGLWLAMAKDLTAQEPMPEAMVRPRLDTASDDEIAEYLEAQPANSMRYPVMLRLWQTGRFSAFEHAVQTISASPSGLLAGPTMAWGAHFAGLPFLAEMLLDEGVPNFLAMNLRAQLASGDVKTVSLHASLEIEPFQPVTIMAIQDAGRFDQFHTTLGKPMQIGDLEKIGDSPNSDTVQPFRTTLKDVSEYLPLEVRDYWSEVSSQLVPRLESAE